MSRSGSIVAHAFPSDPYPGGRGSGRLFVQQIAQLSRHCTQLLFFVLGGGLSRIASTYAVVPTLWDRWVCSGGVREPVRTRLLPALHGDASGVRGAAWLGRGLVA